MASLDLRRLLVGWDYEPNQITVRKIVGDDGTGKIQMRLDLGILQMEVSGRPDGKRPFNFESCLHYYQNQRDKHIERNGTDLGFDLDAEACQALREEAVQYYHRYLAEFVLEDFEAVARDTARNLQVLDLCRSHAREETDRGILEHYRPYLLMMNSRAQAHLALRRGAFKTALARVKAGLRMIEEIMIAAGQEDDIEKSTEMAILAALRDEIAARLPVDPLEQLELELQKAIQEERYEDAMVLRDRMEVMRAQRSLPTPRKRRK
jgi:hypothetical protein